MARLSIARLSCDSSTTFMRVTRTCRREILANLQCENVATLVRLSYDSRAIVLRKHANTSQLSGEKIKLSDIHTNVVRHSHECLATVVRMKMKLKLNSWERRETISRMLHYRATVSRYMFKIRHKFANLSHKCPFNDTAM